MRATGVLLALIMVIAACGSGNDDDAPSGANNTPTNTPAPMDPTITPTLDPAAALAKLESAALALDDLPDGWVEAPELLVDSEDTLICGGEPFESRFEWEAEHRVAYKVSDLGPIVVQGLRVTSPGVADEMMEYTREVLSCEEWTAEDGAVYTLSPLSTATLGDDNFAIRMQVEPFEFHVHYVRVGDVFMLLSHAALAERIDPELSAELARRAVERLGDEF